nr:hypothetical protein GCM10020185_47160 [Pseudomonas brassicacearum subsp. brassicacearum]
MLIDLKPNLHRLSAVSLLAVALTLSACKAPPSSSATPALPAPPEITSGYRTDVQTRYADKHMAAAANPLAAEAGREMLRRGGSAIDAAIAMQAVLTLVEPQSSGIGGGAFIVLWDGEAVRTYDGRETAPAGATERLFPASRRQTHAVYRRSDRRPLRGYAGGAARPGTGPSQTRAPEMGDTVRAGHRAGRAGVLQSRPGCIR